VKFHVKLKILVQGRVVERTGLVSQTYGFNKLLLLECFSFNYNIFLYGGFGGGGEGHALSQLVEALRYKSEGHGFDSRCCHWIFFH